MRGGRHLVAAVECELTVKTLIGLKDSIAGDGLLPAVDSYCLSGCVGHSDGGCEGWRGQICRRTCW